MSDKNCFTSRQSLDENLNFSKHNPVIKVADLQNIINSKIIKQNALIISWQK